MTSQNIAIISKRFWPLGGETEFVAANLAVTLAEKEATTVQVLSSRLFAQWPASFRFRNCQVHRLDSKSSPFPIRRTFEKSCLRFVREHRSSLTGLILTQYGWPDARFVQQVNSLGIKSVIRMGHEIIRINQQEPNQKSPLQLRSAVTSETNCRLVGSDDQVVEFLSGHSISSQCVPDGIPDSKPAGSGDRLATGDSMSPANLLEAKQIARQGLTRSHPLLRIRPRQKLAVILGPLESGRQIEFWLNCWARLPSDFRDSMLWIIGEGQYIHQLWEMIIDLDIEHQVVLGGVFDELGDIFSSADTLLLSDPSQAFSPLTLQAHSHGLPVLAVDSNDCSSQHVSCVPDSMDNAIEQLVRVFKGQTDLSGPVKSARHQVAEFNNMGACAQKYLDLIAN